MYAVTDVLDEKPQKLILEKYSDSEKHPDFESTVDFRKLNTANHARLRPSGRISAAEMIDEDDDDDQFR